MTNRIMAKNGYSDEIGHRTVSEASVMHFGCLTGDYSQMHFDLGFAQSEDMGRPIAHGLLSAAWSLGALTLHASDRLAVGTPNACLSSFRIHFSRPVQIGDRFSLRWSEVEPAPPGADAKACQTLDTDFEVLNQRGELSCSGGLSVCLGEADAMPALASPPEPICIEPLPAKVPTRPLYAQEMPELGPRGISLGRTLTESDIVGFANFTGELNPLYLNEEFAKSGPFGTRIAPPMLVFCLGFGDYLRDLLSIPMPSAGFAGHLGDSWRFFAPVHCGDTIRVRHKPLRCRISKSRSGMAIVEFALQLENQRNEIVQDGRVTMMMPARGEP